MSSLLLTMQIRNEQDVVLTRQRARQIAALLGLEPQDQTRLATAVSEIARNAFQYAGGGRVEFSYESAPLPAFVVRVQDHGPGIAMLDDVLEGRYTSATGMGLGIVGARRLMDRFQIKSSPGHGTTVTLAKHLPPRASTVTARTLARLADELVRSEPQDPLQELRQQNQELLGALAALREREAELEHLNRELEDTNRGVVALYAELDDRAHFLQRASEMKTRFLSNMGHEFRTPLNAILSLSRLLLDGIDGELAPEQEKQVTFIRKSAEDLSDLVNDLLDLARVEAGKILVRSSEFSAADLFGALRGMLRPLLTPNEAVTLIFDEPIGIPALYTDEGKVSQVLRNFISNALKFTERGEIRVSAAMGPDDIVLFSVADTGIGIAPEDQERIFEEFTQLDDPVQKQVKGTGLGLPLSRKLAQLLGGDVYVQSTPGVGSTFVAAIPTQYAGPAEVTFVPEVSREVDPTRLPVLVVEDNRETLFIYEKYLKGTGFQIIPALSLTEARRALREFRPVAVVLDILLEGESTWGFLAELKASGATRDLPVFVVTVIDNANKATAMGADGFAVKPVQREWLLDALQRSAHQPAPARMLIIDDDEIARYLLRGLLADTRYAVVEAGGGSEGLRRAREEQPDVILLDLVMPDMTGYTVLERLKSTPETREIPVIVVTSRILSEEERRLLEAHAVAILPKETPSRDVAIAQIREALAKAGLNANAPVKEPHYA